MSENAAEFDSLEQLRGLLDRLTIDYRPEKYRGTEEEYSQSVHAVSEDVMDEMFSGESPESIERWHTEFMLPECVLAREKALSETKVKVARPGLGSVVAGLVEGRRFAHLSQKMAMIERECIDEVIDRIEGLDADYFDAVARVLRKMKKNYSRNEFLGFDAELATIEDQSGLPEDQSWLKQAGPEAGAVFFFYAFGRFHQRMPRVGEVDQFLRETFNLTGKDSTRRVRKAVGLGGLPRAK